MKESGGIYEGTAALKHLYFLLCNSRKSTFPSVYMNSIRGGGGGIYRAGVEALNNDGDKRTISAFNFSASLLWAPLLRGGPRGIRLMQKSIPHWGGHWSYKCA